ncbi:unnamed protein product [Camellia sinensis]
MNVDQSNTSVLSVDEKKASSGAALPLPSPLASTTTFTKGGNGQDQPASALNSTTETGVSSDSVAAFLNKWKIMVNFRFYFIILFFFRIWVNFII